MESVARAVRPDSSPRAPRLRPASGNHERRGWALWVVFTLVVVGVMARAASPPLQIFMVYWEAGRHWLAGQPLYDGTGWGFLYLPQSALFFTPFSCLPYQWAAGLCRALNIGVFALGVRRFVGLAERDGPWGLFEPVTLLVLPLIVSSARHGQMTLAMGAMMLLAVADLADQRWNHAAVWLTLGLALKPLIVVLILLAVVLYPRLAWRLALGAVVLLVVPFLVQRPAYVLTQYRECVQMFDDAARYALTHPGEYAQLFWMLKSAGIDVPEGWQTVLRLVAAVVTLAVCWWLRGRCSPPRFGVLLLTLAVVYLLLFSPRTERNTYSLLAAPLALYAAQARAAGRRLQAAALLGIVLSFLASYQLGKALTGAPTVWIKPLLCLLFLAVAAWPYRRAAGLPAGAGARPRRLRAHVR